METVDIAGVMFPLYSARPGNSEDPVGIMAGQMMCRRAPNTTLWFVDPTQVMPGWQPVPARPRWNLVGRNEALATWHRDDLSMQHIGEHRWWGPRHHVRIWDCGDHAIGQAHFERWVGVVPRRHEVVSLSVGRDAVVASAFQAGCPVTYVKVGSQGTDWDGRIAVIGVPPGPHRSTGADDAGIRG